MAWKLNDLTLGNASIVKEASDGQGSLTLTLVVTPAERRALAEMFEAAGRVQTFQSVFGKDTSVDTSGGLNTVYLTSGSATYLDSGWFAAESISDGWDLGPTVSVVRLNLRRLAGPSAAMAASNLAAEFLVHDF